MKLFSLVLSVVAFISFYGCDDDSSGPNEIGGNTDLELTKVGNEFGVYFSAEGQSGGPFSEIRDSVYIIENDGGIVTVKGEAYISEEALLELDTLFGTENIPREIKRAALDMYLKKYGASIDTSDKSNMKLDIEYKLKVTSEGIQDFTHSGGDTKKPFTVVKYSSNVGDKYEFTDTEGNNIVREVTYKSSDDDYEMGFLYIKVIKVEQNIGDEFIDKVTYIANHKFGLVGIEAKLKNGKETKIQVLPWALL